MRQYGQLATPAPETGPIGQDPNGQNLGGNAVTALVFRGGSLLCALPLDEVIETMRPLPTRPLAGTPAFVRGISVLRGVPTPVVDVGRLLTGVEGESDRYVAVRTERGPVALSVGAVLGIRTVEAGSADAHPALGGSRRIVAGVATLGQEPLLLLHSMRTVPDEVWDAAAGASLPS